LGRRSQIMAESDPLEEKEFWSERAGLADALVTPLVIINIWFLPFIWLARINNRYTLTNERLILNKGILSKSTDEIELFRVIDVVLHQRFFQRLVGYGTVTVKSSDGETAIMTNLPKAQQRREDLRRLVNRSRSDKGVRTIVS
jgi:uncharacterized membrane protein YdbT with pleckstrin-like domain